MMKKSLIIGLFVLCLFGCEEREKCAVCTTTIYINGSVDNCYEGESTIVCGKELENLNGRVTRVIEEDHAEYTSISITRCK